MMAEDLVTSPHPVLLLGGAGVAASLPVLRDLLAEVPLAQAPVVAADGGAGLARAGGLMPDAVIGDMDSLGADDRAAIDPARLHHDRDQETTDFDKALGAIRAPLVVGVGFTGGRIDHQLAAMTGLALQPEQRCVLVGPEDVICLCPPDLSLDLATGGRLSLYPLAEVRGQSQGLEWPIDGLDFRPDGRIGTSNRVADGPVRLRISGPSMLLILPRPDLRQLLAALSQSDAQWPVRAG